MTPEESRARSLEKIEGEELASEVKRVFGVDPGTSAGLYLGADVEQVRPIVEDLARVSEERLIQAEYPQHYDVGNGIDNDPYRRTLCAQAVDFRQATKIGAAVTCPTCAAGLDEAGMWPEGLDLPGSTQRKGR